jgi:hypothetical protein
MSQLPESGRYNQISFPVLINIGFYMRRTEAIDVTLGASHIVSETNVLRRKMAGVVGRSSPRRQVRAGLPHDHPVIACRSDCGTSIKEPPNCGLFHSVQSEARAGRKPFEKALIPPRCPRKCSGHGLSARLELPGLVSDGRRREQLGGC